MQLTITIGIIGGKHRNLWSSFLWQFHFAGRVFSQELVYFCLRICRADVAFCLFVGR